MKSTFRRFFLGVALTVSILSIPFANSDIPSLAETAGSLPPPIKTGNSVELCLNSRYSIHELNGTVSASDQQLSNVLWAAGRAPAISNRDIYVATTNATYLYNATSHSLVWHSNDITDQGAFVISYQSELAFDQGLSYMPALLASVSLWNSTELPLASCPKGDKLYFGVQPDAALNPELVAHCSLSENDPGWLPDPSTTGNDSLEEVLANLKYISNFAQTNLTLQQISQILWAGYGCTPHETTQPVVRKGLTVPSAYAEYYLTGTIYLANENGTYRYHNRLPPGTDLTTRDHRIEPINSADVRGSLQSAVSGLPQAPCYVILCVNSSYIGDNYAHLETGFVASNMVMQASAIGLGCHFKTNLTSEEQENIQNITNIPSAHIPQVIVSIGPPGVSSGISLTTDGRITFGVVELGATRDTTAAGQNDVQTVRVDSGPVDLYIRTSLFSDSTTTWNLGTANGDNQVKWEFSKDGAEWIVFENATFSYPLASNLAEKATQDIYFRLTMPTSTSSYGEFGVTVTITAAAP